MSLSQPALEAGPAVAEVDKAMQAWFPLSIPVAERQPFSEVDLRSISNILRNTGRESWSRIPRIYATLRSIDQLPLIDIFLTQGLNDVWFPFEHKNLPDSMGSQTARNDFMAAQRLVLNTSLDLEKRDGKHKHFSNQEDVPLIKLAELGRGGSGRVDKVISTVSYREYARKLLPRGVTFRRNKDVLLHFERELVALKQLRHFHIVELIGSYTDPKYVGILTSPVAECNLKDYLAKPLSKNMSSLLRTSFGCLVAAVTYIHRSEIRHKDIKPPNILIKDHRLLITDFGISRDWSGAGHSTTTGPTAMTPKYCAPEVAHEDPRNASSDIWSLGCVFLEVWTVLCGKSVSALETHLKSNGSKSTLYHKNTDSVWSWIQILLTNIQDAGLKPPQTWIALMMQTDWKQRCDAQILFDIIQECSRKSDAGYCFMGQCCIEEEDTEESVENSEYDFEMDPIAPETTTSSATSVGSSDAARLAQVAKLTTRRSPEQVDLQSSTPQPDDLDFSHLSVQEEEEDDDDNLWPLAKMDINLRNLPHSKADEATRRPSHATELLQSAPNPPLVPPQLIIEEATLPRQYYPHVRENAVLRSSGSGVTGTLTEFASLNQGLPSEFPSTNNANFLSVPDVRARKSTPIRDSSSAITSETPITLKVLIDGTQKSFEVEYLSLLHSSIFFDTLRVLVSIPPERRILVKRYSDSADAWITLDPEDQRIWKAMIRAAKAKLKLRLQVKTTSTVPAKRSYIPPPSNNIVNDSRDQRDSSESQMILVHIRFRDKRKKVNIPLERFLHAPTFFATLRSELGAPAYERIIFERYSDSANEYIILDPSNERTHKQTIRAARSKGKVSIQAVVSGFQRKMSTH